MRVLIKPLLIIGVLALLFGLPGVLAYFVFVGASFLIVVLMEWLRGIA